MSNTRELAAIDRIRHQLTTQFAQLAPQRVATEVEDALAEFAHSVVRDYIPVLVERRARKQLANLAI